MKMTNCSQIQKMDLSCLNWEDIVYPHILPLLHYKDWLSLRCCCRYLESKMTTFMSVNRWLYHPIPTERMFLLLTGEVNNLRVLNLRHSIWLKDSHLRGLLQKNQRLQKIDLTDCLGLTPGILQVLTVNCEQLEEVVLGGCGWVTPESLQYHLNHHNSLKKVLSEEPYKTMHPLSVIGEFGLRTQVCLKKKSRYTGKEDLHLRITSREEVNRIHRKYTRNLPVRRQGTLRVLDVSKSYSLSDSVFTKFFQFFREITHLNLAEILRLTDKTMAAISDNLANLSFLDISGNSRISDRGLCTVGRYCSRLRTVKAVGCFGITFCSVQFLSSRNISLERVVVEPPLVVRLPELNLQLIPPYILDSLAVEEGTIREDLAVGGVDGGGGDEAAGGGRGGQHREKVEEVGHGGGGEGISRGGGAEGIGQGGVVGIGQGGGAEGIRRVGASTSETQHPPKPFTPEGQGNADESDGSGFLTMD